MDMRFGKWNVRSLYSVGSLITVSRKLARYKLDLVGVQKVRWKGGGIQPEGEYIFFYGKSISAVKRVQFVSDRMSYIILRGRCGLVIVLDVHAPKEDKTDDVKDGIYEKL
jgi:hypothetical protein